MEWEVFLDEIENNEGNQRVLSTYRQSLRSLGINSPPSQKASRHSKTIIYISDFIHYVYYKIQTVPIHITMNISN